GTCWPPGRSRPRCWPRSPARPMRSWVTGWGGRPRAGGAPAARGRGGALRAGLRAGGEVTPVRSAVLLIADTEPWPVTDLRVDWDDDPVGRLAGLWRGWQPQAALYVQRALHPAEVTELCVALLP